MLINLQSILQVACLADMRLCWREERELKISPEYLADLKNIVEVMAVGLKPLLGMNIESDCALTSDMFQFSVSGDRCFSGNFRAIFADEKERREMALRKDRL